MTHPHTLHATAALWSLRAALRYLAEHRAAVLIQRPQLGPVATRPRSLAQLTAWDVLLREERAERAAGSLRGLKPSAGSAAPVAPGLLDLSREHNEVLGDLVQMIRHAHWSRRPLMDYPAWLVAAPTYAEGRWAYLDAGLSISAPALAAEAAHLLRELDARVRAVCGVPADHWALPLAPACPVCQLRRLRVQTSAPDSRRWTVVCLTSSCACLGGGEEARGGGCPCGMPVRVRGVQHVWDAAAPLVSSALAGVGLVVWALAGSRAA